MESRSDRVWCQGTGDGDLRVCQAAHFLQEKDFPVVLVQRRQSSVEFEAQCRIARFRRLISQLRSISHTCERAQVIPRKVSCDLKDPRSFAAIGGVRGAHGSKERILGQVLRRATITHKAAQEPEDRFPVPNEKMVDVVAIHLGLSGRLEARRWPALPMRFEACLPVKTMRSRNPLT